MTRNQILYRQTVETERSNRANEAETGRHNIATEGETKRSNLARELETNRHNVRTENETERSNLARELETNRHNLQTESISKSQIGLGYAQLSETNRSNLANELERNRSNLANEAETNRANLAREQENYRHNTTVETETNRSNIATENTNSFKAVTDNELRALGFQTQKEVAEIRAASDLAIAELKEQGMNSRQAQKLVSDNVQYYTGLIANLLKSENATKTISDFLFRQSLKNWSPD